MVICLERGADCLHMVQLMPLPFQIPRHLLPHLNQDWFYLSGTSLPMLSWKRGHLTGVLLNCSHPSCLCSPSSEIGGISISPYLCSNSNESSQLWAVCMPLVMLFALVFDGAARGC